MKLQERNGLHLYVSLKGLQNAMRFGNVRIIQVYTQWEIKNRHASNSKIYIYIIYIYYIYIDMIEHRYSKEKTCCTISIFAQLQSTAQMLCMLLYLTRKPFFAQQEGQHPGVLLQREQPFGFLLKRSFSDKGFKIFTAFLED